MTFQQYLLNQLYQVDLLLKFLPDCENENQSLKIMNEIRLLRKKILFIEEMTRSEKQKPLKLIKVIIESKMNFSQELKTTETN